MRGLALVVQFLAQTLRDLGIDFARIDRAVEAAIDRKDDAELIEIGVNRRLHVGIFELAASRAPSRPTARCT